MILSSSSSFFSLLFFFRLRRFGNPLAVIFFLLFLLRRLLWSISCRSACFSLIQISWFAPSPSCFGTLFFFGLTIHYLAHFWVDFFAGCFRLAIPLNSNFRHTSIWAELVFFFSFRWMLAGFGEHNSEFQLKSRKKDTLKRYKSPELRSLSHQMNRSLITRERNRLPAVTRAPNPKSRTNARARDVDDRATQSTISTK